MMETIKAFICKDYEITLKKGILRGYSYDFLLIVENEDIEDLKSDFRKLFNYISGSVQCESREVAERIKERFNSNHKELFKKEKVKIDINKEDPGELIIETLLAPKTKIEEIVK